MSRTKHAVRILAACLGLVLLTSCAGASELDAGTAEGLQARVASAKQLAAQQDFPAALAELQQLDQDVATAAEKGLMSAERKARAEAAISKIRAELEAAQQAAEPQPAPSAEPTAAEDHEDAQKEAEKQLEDAKKDAEKGKGKGNG
ncbi:hypothetical protein [Pseudarthrobacter oxydans]|uniref:hypothetical protein n=1 Tax=Pseudarthrobacter oxydans TaxID=1671 RepID=UPI002AA7F9B8|nr:hypothetical protein [Pseudarthrobacter oxydans]WPU08529.1 hypothetical protein SMD14_15425 [Pseudarthrobacter oxydans]